MADQYNFNPLKRGKEGNVPFKQVKRPLTSQIMNTLRSTTLDMSGAVGSDMRLVGQVGRLGNRSTNTNEGQIVRKLDILSKLRSPGPMVVDTNGFLSNPILSYHKIARRFKKNELNTDLTYHVVVTMAECKQETYSGKRLNGGVPETRHTMMTIHTFNFLQAKLCGIPNSIDDVKTAQELWNEWCLDGIGVSADGQDNQEQELNKTQRTSRERVWNNIIGGPARTFDLWDNQPPGTSLFLILKQVDAPSRYRLGLDSSSYSTPSEPGSNPNRTPRPFQLVPWAKCGHKKPPLSVLRYKDDFGIVRVGVAIFVGTMYYSDGQMSYDELGNRNSGLQNDFLKTISSNAIYIFSSPKVCTL